MKRDFPHLKNPLDDRPRLWAAGVPIMLAYNFVLTWADGMGGVRHDALEWYLSEGEGRVLAPATQDLVREGVQRLIAQDRRLQSEELEKIKENAKT